MSERLQEPAKSISDADWAERRRQSNVTQQHLDRFVLNFLVTEGYVDAAKTFRDEAGLAQETITGDAEERMLIRTALERGSVEEAIGRVNDLNPEILEEEAALCFHLQQQQLIELIRTGNVEDALAFAQEFLAYKGEENEALLEELESTIALIAFPQPDESPVKSLMSIEQRQHTTRAVNSAILQRSCQDVEPRLTATLRMLMWGQEKLAETVKFPQVDWKSESGADADAA